MRARLLMVFAGGSLNQRDHSEIGGALRPDRLLHRLVATFARVAEQSHGIGQVPGAGDEGMCD